MIRGSSDYYKVLYEMYRECEGEDENMIHLEAKSPTLKFTKTKDVKNPVRAHSTDAGIDFFIPNDFGTMVLIPNEDVLIDSGIKVIVPEGYALIFKEKSGVAVNKKLTVGAAVVDSDYRGVVHFHLFNNGRGDVKLNAGDKIIQGVIVPVALFAVEEVSNEEYETNETDRGSGGFGSTGIA